MPRVMLDAGHSGVEHQSPVVPTYYESNIVWDLHLLVKKNLEDWGIEVGTTRANKNDDLEVTQRGKKAKGYDLFVSLHTDASSSEKRDRAVIYHQLYGGGAAKSKEFANFIIEDVHDALLCTQNDYAVKTRKSEKGQWDYYGVLRGSASVNCPGIILECSYHTNERLCKFLLVKKNLENLAEVIADGIARYFGISTLKGDVDGNGRIEAKDYMLLKRIVLGTYKPTPAEIKRSDFDGDGKVNSRDYMLVKRLIQKTL